MTLLNVIGITRFVQLGPMQLAVGVLPYPLTFLCTDLICELYGKRRANFLVSVGLGLNFFILFVLLLVWLPVWLVAAILRQTVSLALSLLVLTALGLFAPFLIGGILYGDMGGRYDTLSNMGYIGRNENKNLQQKLDTIQKKIERFLEILA